MCELWRAYAYSCLLSASAIACIIGCGNRTGETDVALADGLTMSDTKAHGRDHAPPSDEILDSIEGGGHSDVSCVGAEMSSCCSRPVGEECHSEAYPRDCAGCLPGEVCREGDCVKLAACADEIPTKWTYTARFTHLMVPDPDEGYGLDVDGDSSTCTPAGSCSGGVDNQLAALIGDGSPLSTSSELLGQLLGIQRFPRVLVANLASGDKEGAGLGLIPGHPGDGIDDEECVGAISPQFLSLEECMPQTWLPGLQESDGWLLAGGPDEVADIGFEFENYVMSVHVSGLHLGLSINGSEERSVEHTGLIAGAIWQDDLCELIDVAFQLEFVEFELEPGTVKSLLCQSTSSDVDVDGDGHPDAISFGAKFVAVPCVFSEFDWAVGQP
jgi:hypothetical protein